METDPKELKKKEKGRKKAEKQQKFEEKKAKQNVATLSASREKPKARFIMEAPRFVDTTPEGQKKILLDLSNKGLEAYNPVAVESSHYAWWEKMGFFRPQLTIDQKIKPEGSFVIIEPPPNVTGLLHMGHALSGTLQDVMARYYRMKGKTVLWLPGCDHAGISTQTVVEKMLWRTEERTRHDIGREKFLQIAMDWKESYHAKINATKRRMGFSVDWGREAFTMDEDRRKAVSEAFIRLYDDGTIYRANRIVNWDVQLRTAVSNLEVENLELTGRTKLSVPGYEKKIDFGVMTYFQYEVDGSDEKLEIATTRPETLLGDTGVAVNPTDDRYRHLIGRKVRHPFIDRLLPIVADDHVDREFGTGVVKVTPAHDQNDFNIGRRHNLEFINILNDDGTLNTNAGSFADQKRYEARYTVVAALKDRGLFVKEEDNPMVLKLSERSKDVIEPRMKPQWWMKMREMADDAAEAVRSGRISIFPASEENKYFLWMKDIDDWCLSRQLWWGHRVPAYYILWTEDPSPFGSDDSLWVTGRDETEARQRAEARFPNKSFILEQDPDVFDTWFSSGLWPFSTLGWPQQTHDLGNFYPTSVVMTAWDILFFWVARMIMLGIKLGGDIPFREVYCHPIVRDSERRKMSKSLGNVIDPLDVIHGISLNDLHDKLEQGNLDPKEQQRATRYQKSAFPDGIPPCGTDALRFSLAAYSTGGKLTDYGTVTDVNLDIEVIYDYRKFCNKIYQAGKYVLLSLGPNFVPNAIASKTGTESLAERWILHKINHTTKTVNEALEKREFGRCTASIHQYWLHDLCDTYIEHSKYLLRKDGPREHRSVKDTLYTAFDVALTLLHPFMPFLTEELWQRMPRRQGDATLSVSLASYPTFDENFHDLTAESEYEIIRSIYKVNRSLLASCLMNGAPQLYCQISDDADLALARHHLGSIKWLSGRGIKWLSEKGIKDVEILSKEQAKPAGCLTRTVGSKAVAFLLVQGQVDLNVEIKKARSKLDKAEAGLEESRKLLENQEWLSKVAEKVSNGERTKVAAYEADIRETVDMLQQFEMLRPTEWREAEGKVTDAFGGHIS
ncbi:tRNA synthetases class I-domain-containing protein [Hypoxylon sp. NC1633]|nr:tRNA synthetases class I-domain-containing protein [Hypoxylon sp. NC1633]